MKTKILLLCAAIFFSISVQSQNVIEVLTPPSSVVANSEVQITFNYTLAVPGYAFIRFKNGPNTENNLTQISSELLPAGSGTLTLDLPIPSEFDGAKLPLGTGYNYQAQLFDPAPAGGGGWETLATEDYNGVSLVAPANDVNITVSPTIVNGGSSVDITFDYVTDKPNVYIILRLRDVPNGNLSDIGKTVLQGSGTETLSLPIPSNKDGIPLALGAGYSYQAQIFDNNGPTGWSTAIVSKNYEGVTLAEAPNVVTIDNMPTTVAAGSDVDITFDYRTNVANAHIFIRFKDDPNAEGLTSVSQIVTAGSGTLTLPLPIPVNKDGAPLPLGAGYNYQVQIFDIDDNYSTAIINDNIPGITLDPVPAKTIIVKDPVMEVLPSTTVEVTLSYTKDIAGDFIALVRFLDANGDNVGQTFDVVSANSGEITLTLDTPDIDGMYSYQAELYSEDLSTLYYKKRTWGVTVNAALSIGDFKKNLENLSIYPNPFTDSFTYKYDGSLSDSTRIELFTILGKKITTIEKDNTSFGNSGTIDTKNLSKGIYLVRITSGDLQETRKLIKN